MGFYGASALAEIAALKAMEVGLELVCVCDPSSERDRFLNPEVLKDLESAPEIDVWLVTDLGDPLAAPSARTARFGAARVLAPAVLGLDSSDPD